MTLREFVRTQIQTIFDALKAGGAPPIGEYDLAPGTSKMVMYGRIPALLLKPADAPDELRVFVATCTHLNCTVQYQQEGRQIWCACHNGFYDLNGKVVAEKVGSTWTVGYVYLGGALIAQYKSGTTYFAHSDHLGSTRSLSKLDKSLFEAYDFLPFGEELGTISWGTTHKFTGHERDQESGLDDTLFRKFASRYGRWLSPDPLDGDPLDPESWNRYAYVRNSPLIFADPLGRSHAG